MRIKIEEFLESKKSAKEFLDEKIKIKIKENGGSYGCVMLDLTHEKDYRLLTLRNNIPISCIYNNEKGNLGIEKKEHCTVFYGLEDDADLFKIKKYCLENYPNSFILQTNYLHIFENVEKGECDCLVIKCKPPRELLEINQYIKDNFLSKQIYNEYIPHITLAYIKKGTCREFLNKPVDLQFEVSVNDFIYSGHDKVLMENNEIKSIAAFYDNKDNFRVGKSSSCYNDFKKNLVSNGFTGIFQIPISIFKDQSLENLPTNLSKRSEDNMRDFLRNYNSIDEIKLF
jgi:hypothetical protein